MGRNVVLFELNEVPFRVLDTFCANHPNSAVARLLPRLRQLETRTSDVGHLSPWITWPSLHRGVGNESHGIGHFGEDLSEVDRQFPPIWKLLQAEQVRTGVFASLHTHPVPENIEEYAFYVPDSFAPTPEAHPRSLASFQGFNLQMSRASGRNVDRSLQLENALPFLAKAPFMGLRPSTVLDLGKQILDERRHPWRSARRRTYQTVLAFDFFMKLLATEKPQFTTFFTNHVASAMHRYWAARFPEDYDELEYDADWIERYGPEIDFAMEKFDQAFARLVAFVDRQPDTVLLVASSMGQRAQFGAVMRTQLYLREHEKFLSWLGLEAKDWKLEAAMEPDVNFLVETSRQDELQKRLSRILIDGKPIQFELKEGFLNLHFGQANLDDEKDLYLLDGESQVPLPDLGFENVQIEDEAGSTAYHCPEGMLLIYDPRAAEQDQRREELSVAEIAPAILRNFGAPVPDYMSRRQGLTF